MFEVLILLALVSGAAGASTACGVNMIVAVRASVDIAPRLRVAVPYLVGSLVGATVVGLGLGAMGVVLVRLVPTGLVEWQRVTSGILLAASVVLGLREVGILRIRLPQRESQLNSDGLALKVSRRMFGFGLWLGMGFLTFSPYGGLHLLAVACVLQNDLVGATVLFSAFGVGRGAFVVFLALAARSWGDARRIGDVVARRYLVAHRVTALVFTVVAVMSLRSLMPT